MPVKKIKSKLTLKQTQKQTVIVNIGQDKPKRRRAPAPRKPKKDADNKPKPDSQPQMIIHQQSYQPQQQYPSSSILPVSALEKKFDEYLKQQDKGNKASQTETEKRDQTTNTSSSQTSDRPEFDDNPEPQSSNDALINALRRERSASMADLSENQREPTVLEPPARQRLFGLYTMTAMQQAQKDATDPLKQLMKAQKDAEDLISKQEADKYKKLNVYPTKEELDAIRNKRQKALEKPLRITYEPTDDPLIESKPLEFPEGQTKDDEVKITLIKNLNGLKRDGGAISLLDIASVLKLKSTKRNRNGHPAQKTKKDLVDEITKLYLDEPDLFTKSNDFRIKPLFVSSGK